MGFNLRSNFAMNIFLYMVMSINLEIFVISSADKVRSHIRLIYWVG